MARTVLGGLIQMSNPINDPNVPVGKVCEAMEEKHLPFIEEAGKRGVQILCLQEIFNGPYFCPSQDSRWCDIAEAVPGPTVEMLAKIGEFEQVVWNLEYDQSQFGGTARTGWALVRTINDIAVIGFSERRQWVPAS